MLSNILDRISFSSLFLVVILLPVFFLPFTRVPIETSKGLFLVVGLVISIIFWVVARFSDGKIVFPKSRMLLSGFLVVLVFLLSALFSGASSMSFFGIMFEVGTFWFIFSAFLLMFACSVILRDPENAKTLLFGAIVSATAVLIFQGFRLFFPDVLSFGVLAGKTGNVLGSWNTFGIFAGFTAIVSLFVVEFFYVSRLTKFLLSLLLLLSVLMIAAVNFLLVWELLGIFALIIFIYKISLSFSQVKTEEDKTAPFPFLSFAIVMVSLLFFIPGQFSSQLNIGGLIPNRLGLSNVEVSPSFSATMSVAGKALRENPILGIGPNRFGEVWALYKPEVINSTPFWGTNFSSGSGILPTFAGTVGLLGILSWLIFFFFFLVAGIRSLFYSIKNNVNQITSVFFVASLYLFVSCFFYSAGPAIFLLALAFAGVFIGLSTANRPNREITIAFSDSPRKSFFSLVLLIVLMIVSVAMGFKYIERFASVPYFERALLAQNIEEAESAIVKANSLHYSDLYLRTYAQVYLIKLSSIVSTDKTLSPEDKAKIEESFKQAVAGAQSAVAYNKSNYLNHQMLGSVYYSAATLGVEGAYSQAIDTFKQASLLNPLNPGIRLDMARASFADRKVKEAKNYANEALTLKKDYIDALIVLSQIAKSEGNTNSAISYAEQALALLPNNKELIDYVNSLKNPGSPPAPAPTITPTLDVKPEPQ